MPGWRSCTLYNFNHRLLFAVTAIELDKHGSVSIEVPELRCRVERLTLEQARNVIESQIEHEMSHLSSEELLEAALTALDRFRGQCQHNRELVKHVDELHARLRGYWKKSMNYASLMEVKRIA